MLSAQLRSGTRIDRRSIQAVRSGLTAMFSRKKTMLDGTALSTRPSSVTIPKTSSPRHQASNNPTRIGPLSHRLANDNDDAASRDEALEGHLDPPD